MAINKVHSNPRYFRTRVKLWKQFFHETGVDIGAYLSDVKYRNIAPERIGQIEKAAIKCADWPIVPQRRKIYLLSTNVVKDEIWVLRDRKRK